MSDGLASLILIAGSSGAGKSVLAGKLAQTLACPAISLDHYYHPLDHLSVEERAEQNFDHPDALDWELLETHVAALSSGASIRCPRYLFDQHTRAADSKVIEPREYLIIEGIHSFYREALRSRAVLRIFVAAPEGICLERRIRRDLRQRGRSRESVLAQFEATVRPMARQFLEPARQYADLAVSGEQDVGDSIAAILRLLRFQRPS